MMINDPARHDHVHIATAATLYKSAGIFSRHLISYPDCLSPDTFEHVRDNARRLEKIERSYIPTHKKGGTVAYDTILQHAPEVARFYQSAQLQELVSGTVDLDVRPTPTHDQSSLSLLIYDKPGDHIDWHYDHNFYKGRHFTVLLTLINTGRGVDGLSHARLLVRDDDQERAIVTRPNTIVIFEGAKVLHKVTPIVAGERRVVLSMTFCADAAATWGQAAARRIKDTAFFGVRALWT